MQIGQILDAYNPWWEAPAALPSAARRFPVRRQAAFDEMLASAAGPRGRSLVVRGPRRVGKTVLLHQLAAELMSAHQLPPGRLLAADLSDPAFRLVGRDLDLLDALGRFVAERVPEGRAILLLDELQGIEGWDRWLKHTCDHTEVTVVATGSSSLELARGGAESGRGRWDELQLEGLTYSEWLLMGSPPGSSLEDALVANPTALEDYLEGGGMPEYVGSLERPAEQRRKLRFELERDLKSEVSDVKDPNDTWRLYQALAQDSGNSPSVTKLASTIGINKKTVKAHLHQLEQQLLVSRLKPSTCSPKGQIRSVRNRLADEHIFAVEHGHVSALSVASAPLANDHLRGRIYETAVYTALRVAARQLGAAELGYLREDKGAEIDFVLTLEDRMVGVEVSSTERADKKATLAKKAGEAFGIDVIVVSAHPSEQVRGGVRCVSMGTFLLDTVNVLSGGR